MRTALLIVVGLQAHALPELTIRRRSARRRRRGMCVWPYRINAAFGHRIRRGRAAALRRGAVEKMHEVTFWGVMHEQRSLAQTQAGQA
ncbi:hypothetical protein [Janthinobacterium sp. CAN_S1]|uniref:hypothetical protein n=1 Tax=Janthinobacterium sp. CAN_S1 TaxID=2787725 RepID=UPI0018CA8806